MATLTKDKLHIPDIDMQDRTIYLQFLANRKRDYDFNVFLPKYGRNLQRELCWTLEQKRALIQSLLNGNSIAPVFCWLNYYRDDKGDHEVYEVIDGKQRLNAIFDFFDNKYSIVVDGQEYYAKDFDIWLMHCIQHNLPLMRCNIEAKFNDDDKIAWFLRLNYAGVPQQTEYLEDLSNLLKH